MMIVLLLCSFIARLTRKLEMLCTSIFGGGLCQGMQSTQRVDAHPHNEFIVKFWISYRTSPILCVPPTISDKQSWCQKWNCSTTRGIELLHGQLESTRQIVW